MIQKLFMLILSPLIWWEACKIKRDPEVKAAEKEVKDVYARSDDIIRKSPNTINPVFVHMGRVPTFVEPWQWVYQGMEFAETL